MKRLLAVLLALILIMTNCNLIAFSEEDDPERFSYSESDSVEDAGPPINQYAVVQLPNNHPLNIRKEPGLYADVVGRLDNGNEVLVVRHIGQWSEICCHDGRSGYVMSKYLSGTGKSGVLFPISETDHDSDKWAGRWFSDQGTYRSVLNIVVNYGDTTDDFKIRLSIDEQFDETGHIVQIDSCHMEYHTEQFSGLLILDPKKDEITLTNITCSDYDLSYILEQYHYEMVFTRVFGDSENHLAVGSVDIEYQEDSDALKTIFTVDFSTYMFMQDTTVFHEDISKLAVLLSANAYNLKEENPGHQIVNAYRALGINDDHIMLFNYQGHYLNVYNDPISDDLDEFSIASRDMGEFELLVITIRGSGRLFPLSLDWVSNFFAESAESMNAWVDGGFLIFMFKVYNGLEKYLSKHPEIEEALREDRLKVLITGHSRGGAVANLLGAYLLDESQEEENPMFPVDMDDMFVYTYACPRVVHEKDHNPPNLTDCANIFNIVINRDPVPQLPEDVRFSWKRYGITYTYDTTFSDLGNFQHHKPLNYIRVVLFKREMRKQSQDLNGVIVSNDPVVHGW